MSLKITEVKSATVVGNYYWTYARVYAGDLYGTGEGFFAPSLEDTIREFGRVIIGENALDVNRVCDKLHWAAVPSGASGANYHALSALNIALLDLVGKHLNVPVYTLLGGKFRDRVRVYVDTHAGEALEAMDSVTLPITTKWMREEGARVEETGAPAHGRAYIETFTDAYTPEAYGKRAKQMRDEGYTAIKFDLDVPTPYTKDYNRASGSLTNKEVEYLAELVGSVRSAAEEADILFDLHWRFNVESAIRLAKAVEQYHVMWLEDPVPPANPELFRAVTSSTSTPIATGENLYTRYEFMKVLDSGIRIITPDILKTGGPSASRFIAELAGLNEITVSPHNISSPIGTMAQAHFAAAIPNFGVLEFHGHDVPIWWKLANKEIIKDGFIEMTDEPGLGVELNEEVAAKYSLGEFQL
nr:mandelate racemase/muconate lactonizing enzyme family protein [Candidatus Freyarchaeota archaeon]